MDEAARSPALSAKRRERGPSVLERRRAEEAAVDAAEAAAAAPRRRAVNRPVVEVECTGGKSMKTGMVLARAQLSESASGVLAARERQMALLGKSEYREAEKVAREAPVGSLSTKAMPKKKNAGKDAAQHQKAFGAWMREALSGKVWAARASQFHASDPP